MRHILLGFIRFYRRFISPYKGFSCAYRVYTGRCSCSALGLRAVRRHGVAAGLAILRQRLHRCGVAHRRWHVPVVAPRRRWLAQQRGECDLGCDAPCDPGCDSPCEGSSGGGKWSCWDVGCDCNGCDLGRDNCRRRRDGDDERDDDVHLPPKRDPR